MTALAGELHQRRGARASPWALLVLLLSGSAGLVWLVVHEPQRSWEASDAVAVTLDGEHYRLSPQQLVWLARFSAEHFNEGEQAARALAAAEIDARLDQVFGAVHVRLPEFADWHYSLGGEYARLAMLALSWLDLAEGDYIARRAAEMLFPEGVWDSELARLDAATVARLQRHQEQVREGWLGELAGRLSPHRVPAPIDPPAAGSETRAGDGQVRLEALAGRLLAREREALQSRVVASTIAAGGAAAGPAVWRAAGRRSAAVAGRSVSRGIGRGAARAGSAAAGGAAICGPGGPLALGCAALAGAGTWLATDWLLLRIDEHVNREEMLHALELSLAAFREDMERDLLAAYDAFIAEYYSAVHAEIEHTFVPARAAGHL